MKILAFSFENLLITPSDIEELMGFDPGESPDPFPELIRQALKSATEYCHICGGFQIFNTVYLDPLQETIQIENQIFLPGKTVVTQLKNISKAALFVCTAGAEISDLARQTAAEGDEMTAYLLDVIGSVTVDKAAGKLQEMILEEVAPSGLGITDPFSPGYCNWSVADQQKLFSLLPSNPCNITLSDSSLMHPIKSVSGITGIGADCQQKGYQCNWCTDNVCLYGKIRRQKKAKKNL